MASKTRNIILLLRPWFWLPGIASGIAGSLWAENSRVSLDALLVILIVIGPGICAFAEVFNDFSDIGFDAKEAQKCFLGLPMSGGSGVLAEGSQERIILGQVLMGTSIIIGAAACLLLPLRVFPFILGGYCLSWAYSGLPFRAKHRGIWGTFLQGLGYGPVAFYIGYAVSRPLILDIGLLLSILIGTWTALVGITADILDYEHDARQGIRTLAVQLGPINTRVLAICGGVACLTIGIAVSPPPQGVIKLFLMTVTTALFALYSWKLIASRDRTLSPGTHSIAILLEFLFPMALTVG